MSRYIDADKLHYTRVLIPQKDGTISGSLHAAVLSCEIKDAPAADVEEVRHGKWIKDENGKVRCSHCRELAYKSISGFYITSAYCGDCGAQMDLKGE